MWFNSKYLANIVWLDSLWLLVNSNLWAFTWLPTYTMLPQQGSLASPRHGSVFCSCLTLEFNPVWLEEARHFNPLTLGHSFSPVLPPTHGQHYWVMMTPFPSWHMTSDSTQSPRWPKQMTKLKTNVFSFPIWTTNIVEINTMTLTWRSLTSQN